MIHMQIKKKLGVFCSMPKQNRAHESQWVFSVCKLEVCGGWYLRMAGLWDTSLFMWMKTEVSMFSQGDSINIHDCRHRSFCYSSPLGRSNCSRMLDVAVCVWVLNEINNYIFFLGSSNSSIYLQQHPWLNHCHIKAWLNNKISFY